MLQLHYDNAENKYCNKNIKLLEQNINEQLIII